MCVWQCACMCVWEWQFIDKAFMKITYVPHTHTHIHTHAYTHARTHACTHIEKFNVSTASLLNFSTEISEISFLKKRKEHGDLEDPLRVCVTRRVK